LGLLRLSRAIRPALARIVPNSVIRPGKGSIRCYQLSQAQQTFC